MIGVTICYVENLKHEAGRSGNSPPERLLAGGARTRGFMTTRALGTVFSLWRVV